MDGRSGAQQHLGALRKTKNSLKKVRTGHTAGGLADKQGRNNAQSEIAYWSDKGNIDAGIQSWIRAAVSGFPEENWKYDYISTSEWGRRWEAIID